MLAKRDVSEPQRHVTLICEKVYLSPIWLFMRPEVEIWRQPRVTLERLGSLFFGYRVEHTTRYVEFNSIAYQVQKQLPDM